MSFKVLVFFFKSVKLYAKRSSVWHDNVLKIRHLIVDLNFITQKRHTNGNTWHSDVFKNWF